MYGCARNQLFARLFGYVVGCIHTELMCAVLLITRKRTFLVTSSNESEFIEMEIVLPV